MALSFDEIDLENIGSWSVAFKTLVIVIICGLILFAGFWLDTREQKEVLASYKLEEDQLRKDFADRQSKAVNLEAYKEQLATIKEYFGALLRQLPGSTEVPGLVEDISHIGLENGLDFNHIRLKSEEQRDFYTELPIDISVTGNYHQLAQFISDVAALPRIVTIHDFSIVPDDTQNSADILVMNIIAKTYRYTAVDEEESL